MDHMDFEYWCKDSLGKRVKYKGQSKPIENYICREILNSKKKYGNTVKMSIPDIWVYINLFLITKYMQNAIVDN